MKNTKKILFTALIAGIAIMPCAFAGEKENPYSIKSLEKDFYYKNIEHKNFYPSSNPTSVKTKKRTNTNSTPKIYNIDLNSTNTSLKKPETVTYNQNLYHAKKAITEGDFKTGLVYLNQVSEKSPSWVLAETASLYEQINQLHLALKTYEKAIAKGDNRIELLYNQASCLYKSNNLNKAQEVYEEVISIAPDFMLAYYSLGNIHFKSNNYYKALRYYKKSLELNPLSLDSLYNMSVTLEMINEPKLALKYYQKYTHIDPSDNQVKNAVERLQEQLTKTTT